MLLRSHIKDESKVTFDCAKATIKKGDIIKIADEHFRSNEIQNALKMGLISIEGEIPVLPEDPLNVPVNHKIRFKNTHFSKLCFECIKDYVEPNNILHVPVDKIDSTEIRNAIAAGWLVNIDSPQPTAPVGNNRPVVLEELKLTDLITEMRSALDNKPKETLSTDGLLNAARNHEASVDSESIADLTAIMNTPRKDTPLPDGVPARRPVKKTKAQKTEAGPIKAKPISRKDDALDEDFSGDLYRPSEIIEPKGPKALKQTKAENDEDDSFLTDIFKR